MLVADESGAAMRPPRAASEGIGETAVTAAPFPGYVDFFGYSRAAGGWLFSGWIARPYRTDDHEPVDFVAQYERSHSKGKPILTTIKGGISIKNRSAS